MESLIAKTWLAAARAEYVNPRDWQRWADRMIEAVPTPPIWIIDMSMVGDTQRLETIFSEEFYSEWFAETDCSMDELELGFIWLRHRRGDFSLASCLQVAGGIADGGQVRKCCESFYELVNRLERGELRAKIESEASELFDPMGRCASDRWAQVQQFMPVSV